MSIDETMNTASCKRAIPGVVFWLIWGAALIPLLVASIAFLSGWRPVSQINSGHLYESGLRIEEVDALQQVDLVPGKWQLILLVNAQCDQQCEIWNKLLPNVHVSLGRERQRVSYQQFETEEVSNGLVVVDPMGFMVIKYGLEQSPQSVLKDLKRLLKVSKVG